MLQDMFNYSNIVNFPDGISIEMIMKLSQVMEKKYELEREKAIEQKILKLKKADPQKYKKLSVKDFLEKRYYISKFHELSSAEFKRATNLLSITESDMTISVNESLDLKTYRLHEPLDLSICLVPFEDGKEFEKDGALHIYRGLIHSVGENDKKELRSYVNSVFFSELNEKRDAELAEFQAKNQEAKSSEEEEGSEEKSEEEPSE